MSAALLAWVVLAWAPSASGAVPPAREAAGRAEAACEARAASLDRATAAVDRLRGLLVLRLRTAGASCRDLADFDAAALLAEGIAEGMRVQAARCPVPDGYADDARGVADGAAVLVRGIEALRAACMARTVG